MLNLYICPSIIHKHTRAFTDNVNDSVLCIIHLEQIGKYELRNVFFLLG